MPPARPTGTPLISPAHSRRVPSGLVVVELDDGPSTASMGVDGASSIHLVSVMSRMSRMSEWRRLHRTRPHQIDVFIGFLFLFFLVCFSRLRGLDRFLDGQDTENRTAVKPGNLTNSLCK